MNSFPVRCCCISTKREKEKVTVNLTESQKSGIHPHSSPFHHPNFKSPSHHVTMRSSSYPFICMFPSPLPDSLPPPLPPHHPLFFFDFHSLAQTALALTPGHPMLSLSNYLTNRRETALISAYCSAPLKAASLGGLSGKPWRGGSKGQAGRPGENNSAVQLDL